MKGNAFYHKVGSIKSRPGSVEEEEEKSVNAENEGAASWWCWWLGKELIFRGNASILIAGL